MKKSIITIFSLLILLLANKSLIAQIPNNGFDTWSTVFGVESPDDWNTSDQEYTGTKSKTISKDSVSYKGKYALRANAFYMNIAGFSITLPGYAYTQFAINFRPTYMVGFYKGKLTVKDTAVALVSFFRNNGSSSDSIGGGIFLFPAGNVTNYQMFVMPINYTNSNNPDSAMVFVGINSSDSSALGNITFDELLFTSNVGINENPNVIASTIYPNPASDQATMKVFAKSNSDASIEVLDITGKTIISKMNYSIHEGPNNITLDLNNLQSGTYFCRINLNGELQTQKLIISK